MTETHSFSQGVPTFARADVIVVGGGPAGIGAAIAARRCGKSVILLERSAQLGGMGVLANVSIWMPVGNVTGIYREVCRDLNLQTHYVGKTSSGKENYTPLFSPFEVRQYFNQKLESEGVDVLFHVDAVGVVQREEKLVALVANTLEGLKAFEAEVFVDATGDARVARDAGVKFHIGREEDGLTQPMTLMFQMQNTGQQVDARLPDGCPKYETINDLPQARHLHWLDKTHGTLLVNMTRVKGNGASIRERSQAEREGLRQAFGVAEYLQRSGGMKNFVLSHVPAQIGVRETYRIEGLYTLTEDDIRNSRRFPDVIAQTDYCIDVHNPKGKGGTKLQDNLGYDIPFRCVVPAHGPVNLLVSGRSLSATHIAMSSARVQPTCMAMGQAAGCAAAISLDQNCLLKDVPTHELHARMHAQGVEFENKAVLQATDA